MQDEGESKSVGLESPTPEVTSFLGNSDNSNPEGGRIQATPKDAFNLTTTADTSGSHKKQGKVKAKVFVLFDCPLLK